MVNDDFVGDGMVGDSEVGNRYLGIDLVPATWHDIGLVLDMLANQRAVEVGYTFIDNQVGDRRHLDFNELDIIAILWYTGVELERLEPLVQHLALQLIIVAFMQTCQFQGEGTVATERLDMGFAVFLRIDDPIFFLRTLFDTDGAEERYSGLFIDRVARINHTPIHRGAKLQLATQLGMIDDMGTIGLEHVLDDAYSLGVVSVFKGLGSQILIAEESWRQYFRMLAGNIVQVVRLQMARGQRQTVVNGTEGILIARQVGLVVCRRDFSLEEHHVDLHR